MSDPQPLEATIDIAATPAQVWALVSDLPRMASWSPQVVRSTVKGGAVKQGARVTNLNRQGLLFWPTHAKVVRFEPHRDFAFRVAENKVIWSFELADTGDGGTRLTQRREIPDGVSTVSRVMTRIALGGTDDFTTRLRSGMAETLDKIKATAEA